MADPTPLGRVLRGHRTVTVAALSGITALAWIYILLGAGMDMAGMAPMPWTPGHLGLMFAMWAAMMVAMMLPSAAPMILLFAALECRREAPRPAAASQFVAGYAAVWAGFSLAATALQWRLESLALASPTIVSASAALSGSVLLVAGLYQLTPLKHACLRHCRSPLDFLALRWRQEPFAMGLHHGLYCVGCCWAIMGLLFVGGVMNLLWIAAICLFVLVEKVAPHGAWVGRAVGAGLILWGGWTLVAAAAQGSILPDG